MVPLLVLLTFLGVILVVSLYKKFYASTQVSILSQNGNGIKIHAIPSGYRLMNNHLWIHEDSPEAKMIGIDELLQKFIGIPDRINLKSPGHIVSRGESLAVIQKDGKELHIWSPYDAKISRTNVNLLTSLKIVSTDPYRIGWLYQLSQIDPNLDKEFSRKGHEAVDWLKTEYSRLKEFVQQFIVKPEPIGITLADGGELETGLMSSISQKEIIKFEEVFLK